jgi:tRNA1Val (adenine37-N6)-methyltransferase
VRDELTCDAITADYRLWQRRGGHRTSLDDLATAFVASRARPRAERYLDLGSGVGSVLLMVAWRLPAAASLTAIEAQSESFALLTRNVAGAGLSERATLLHGDLREAPPLEAPVELVTGTPPYLPVGTAVPSPDPQRAAARLELRGGVEDYVRAGARCLAATGALVVCAGGGADARVERAAREVELTITACLDVRAHARAERPLFSVWTLEREAVAGPRERALARTTLVTRDAAGARTPEHQGLRAHFGL